MLSLYLTLSLRYFRRRWFYAAMIVASIASGVCLLVATRIINQTMTRAAQTTMTPMSGAVDLIVSGGDVAIDQKLVEELRIPGVQTAWPRIFENVELPQHGNRTVLVIGIDALAEQKDASASPWRVEFSDKIEQQYAIAYLTGGKAVVVGKSLAADLGADKKLQVRSKGKRDPTELTRVGTVDARGAAASLGGNVLILELANARAVLGLPQGKVHRIDLTFSPAANRDQLRQEIARLVAGRAEVRTPDEQNKAVQNVMAGMQTGLLLCGIFALVVGLFLVYNALSVSVAERRHEIGILLAVGATRGQIRKLFAGEAALLGLAGSLIGIPLGVGCAHFALEPVRGVLEEIFFTINASGVQIDMWLVIVALIAGITTSVLAALMPAIQAAREKPADAVRRIPAMPTWRHRFLQITTSATMLLTGALLVTGRDRLPPRIGMYTGLALVVVGALLAMPLLTALAAHSLQPIVRRFFGLEARLAADNLIRAPGRTGIVIAALASGVALFIQTAGTIKSNRIAIRQWVDESIAADLVVSSGSPVSAGGKSKPMSPALGDKLESIAGVDRTLAIRMRKPIFQGTQIMLFIFNARDYYGVDSVRNLKANEVELYKKLGDTKDAALVSENFAALHSVKPGDVIPLASPRGLVQFTIIGQITDYSWNHGSVFINSADYDSRWADPLVDVYDVYLNQDVHSWALAADICRSFGFNAADSTRFLSALKMQRKQRVQEEILKKCGAEHGLFVLTREEMQDHIDGMIERLYGIAYGQQVVVLFVAALGIVTALLISVLQRRREMGLLRAIGGSRLHVIRCVLAEAALMGLIGCVIGFLVGIPLEWFALQVIILEESGYCFPVIVPWTEGLVIALAAIAVAILAGLGPSLYAVRQRIPEAIAME